MNEKLTSSSSEEIQFKPGFTGDILKEITVFLKKERVAQPLEPGIFTEYINLIKRRFGEAFQEDLREQTFLDIFSNFLNFKDAQYTRLQRSVISLLNHMMDREGIESLDRVVSHLVNTINLNQGNSGLKALHDRLRYTWLSEIEHFMDMNKEKTNQATSEIQAGLFTLQNSKSRDKEGIVKDLMTTVLERDLEGIEALQRLGKRSFHENLPEYRVDSDEETDDERFKEEIPKSNREEIIQDVVYTMETILFGGETQTLDLMTWKFDNMKRKLIERKGIFGQLLDHEVSIVRSTLQDMEANFLTRENERVLEKIQEITELTEAAKRAGKDDFEKETTEEGSLNSEVEDINRMNLENLNEDFEKTLRVSEDPQRNEEGNGRSNIDMSATPERSFHRHGNSSPEHQSEDKHHLLTKSPVFIGDKDQEKVTTSGSRTDDNRLSTDSQTNIDGRESRGPATYDSGFQSPRHSEQSEESQYITPFGENERLRSGSSRSSPTPSVASEASHVSEMERKRKEILEKNRRERELYEEQYKKELDARLKNDPLENDLKQAFDAMDSIAREEEERERRLELEKAADNEFEARMKAIRDNAPKKENSAFTKFSSGGTNETKRRSFKQEGFQGRPYMISPLTKNAGFQAEIEEKLKERRQLIDGSENSNQGDLFQKKGVTQLSMRFETRDNSDPSREKKPKVDISALRGKFQQGQVNRKPAKGPLWKI